MPRFRILHTNDFHNHLTPHQADRLSSLRRADDVALLLDAGDAVSSGNLTFRSEGEPILDAMSAAGYDAMTAGNREFHFTQAGFRAKLSRARFPVLCANVRARSAGERPPVVPFAQFRHASGHRIAVFGVTVPMITERMLSSRVSAYVFEQPLAAAIAMASQLRRDCDLLICLSHAGLSTDRLIAERARGIGLIVGGHTHAVLERGERVGECLIVQAGSHGRFVGTVEVDASEEKTTLSAKLEPL
jgi:2',3'-cyclic-nucleotide 2'-phosphodiesterase (5'-nucleotidase family)